MRFFVYARMCTRTRHYYNIYSRRLEKRRKPARLSQLSAFCCEIAQKSCEKLKVFVQKVETKKLFKKALKFLKSCDTIFGVKGKRLDEKKDVATKATETEEHHEQ